MKASGNAAPETCVQNLLKTIRGEVPYERIKGIDRTLIDRPSGTIKPNQMDMSGMRRFIILLVWADLAAASSFSPLALEITEPFIFWLMNIDR